MKTLTRFTNLPRLITATMFGALVLGCGALSSAADNGNFPQVVVKFGDLNVSDPQGAATLYVRITAAAYEVCQPFDIDPRILGSQARLDACVHGTIANAVTKVGQPALFSVYRAKHPRTRPLIVAAAR